MKPCLHGGKKQGRSTRHDHFNLRLQRTVLPDQTRSLAHSKLQSPSAPSPQRTVMRVPAAPRSARAHGLRPPAGDRPSGDGDESPGREGAPRGGSRPAVRCPQTSVPASKPSVNKDASTSITGCSAAWSRPSRRARLVGPQGRKLRDGPPRLPSQRTPRCSPREHLGALGSQTG